MYLSVGFFVAISTMIWLYTDSKDEFVITWKLVGLFVILVLFGFVLIMAIIAVLCFALLCYIIDHIPDLRIVIKKEKNENMSAM